MEDSTILYSPGEMRSKASDFSNEADVVTEMLGRLETYVADLAECWQGAASQSFADAVEELKAPIQNMVDVLESVSKSLIETADSVESADSNTKFTLS